MKTISYQLVILLLIFFSVSALPQSTETKLIQDSADPGFAIKNSSGDVLLKVTEQGNVGIGKSDPTEKLVVTGSIAWGNTNAILQTDQGASIELRGIGTPYIDFSNDPTSDYTARLMLNQNNILEIAGNVGIGTNTTNGYNLAVGGNMIAEEIVVKLRTNWPDYVFHKDYKISDIDELENFIDANGHLPNIPNANEVTNKGVNVGEMQAKLLEKIEELTLYLIEQNKKIKELENDYQLLKEKFEKEI